MATVRRAGQQKGRQLRLLLLVCAALLAAGPAPAREPLQVLVQEAKGLAYLAADGQTATGAGVDILRAIAKDAGIEMQLSLMPLARMVATIDASPNSCAVSIA